VGVETGHLQLGDFLIDGRLLVERKTSARALRSRCCRRSRVSALNAPALLLRFGGIGAPAAASPREIAEVLGVGRTMAARIRWVVGDGGVWPSSTR
jgi:ERCC4-type nuclease